MIIAVFLPFQIILFLQLTTVCMKNVKNREKAGRLPNTERKNTSKAEQDKQENENHEEKENRSDKKHGEKDKKKASEMKCEEKKASEKRDEEEKDEEEKEETKKDEENKKEKKEQEKDAEKKTEKEKKEDQGKDELKKEDKMADDKKDLKKGLKLDVSPAELKWEFEQGQQAIKVKNNTTKRFAVKVKCTDTNIYTVAPAIAFVDAGKLLTIAVVRDKGAMKKDKIVVCSMPVSDDEKDAAEVFKNVNPNVNVIQMDKRIYV